MKRNPFILVSLMLFSFISLISTPSTARKSSLNLTVDPRIELLAVVQLLSGYGERFSGRITQHDFSYKSDVVAHFSQHKRHLAVRLFTKMSDAGFSYDAPPAAMLYLSDPPDLTLQSPFTDYLNKRAGGNRELKRFVKALRDFARKTQFMAFFEEHEETFARVVDDARKKTESTDYIGTLENYYGMKQNSYNIVLALLFHPGGYGPRIERADGTYDIYNIGGPKGAEGGIPTFGTVDDFRYLAWHEFSHSFVNPLTEKFSDQIAQYSSLYNPISDKMKAQAYGNWQICTSEHIVRAITTRFTYRESGKEAGDEALQNEEKRGFFYVEALCKRLEQYEGQREKYPTFVDYYLELIGVFKKLSQRELGDDFYSVPFMGPINAVGADKTSVVLVIPTHESDKTVQSKIHAYVRKVRDSFFKGSPIVTDEQALKQDLSSKALFVYGTPSGNSWLSKCLIELPVDIKSDRDVADTVYIGTHLRFITAWPNSQNPQKGVVIYTAQKAEDIVGMNSVFHGPTDYVVAEGTEVLIEANYKKQNDGWTFR